MGISTDSRRRAAGDIIEARCTKCRSLLNHTIVAMVGERVVRVQCNTCGGQHNYHPPQAERAGDRPATGKATAERPRREKAPAGPSEWEVALTGLDPANAVPYAMEGSFRSGQLVAHPTFGLGVVTALCKPNKVEILFSAGKKLLCCAL